MKFKVETNLNDGLADAPPLTYDVPSVERLLANLLAHDAFTNDYGVPVPVGTTVTIERKA